MRFMTSRRAWLAGAALLVALAPLSAQQAPAERIDYDAIYKISSREYVSAHFANAADMVLKPAHAKVSGYFNVDNGTGAIRGGNSRPQPAASLG